MVIDVGYDKSIEISHISARTLLLNSKNTLPIISRKSDEILDNIIFYEHITSINFHDNYKIELGDDIILKGKNIPYKINYIDLEVDGNFYLTEERLNKSTYFITPVILEGTYKNYLFNTCYFNSYLGTKNDNNYLYIVYKFIDISGYKSTETYLTGRKNFIKVIDSNKTFSTFVFKIPPEYTELLKFFWEGNYHIIDPKIKETIKKFYENPEGLVKKINFEVNKSLNNDMRHIKNLEDSLGAKLPAGMNIISKPKLHEERIKI